MGRRILLTVAALAVVLICSTTGRAQQCGGSAPFGTVPACGYGPGQYRPQPYTLSGSGRVVERPGTWYAPSGRNQQYWNQYYPPTRSYGPREPNPFGTSGNLSPSRAVRHLLYTRVLPRVSGYRYR